MFVCMTMAAEPKFPTRLDKWLWTSRKTGAEFARALGVSRASVSRWRTGAETPPSRMREAIRKATKGAVTENDWQD